MGAFFIFFDSLSADAVDRSAIAPPTFSVPESSSFAAPALPKQLAIFSDSGGIVNLPGGLGNAPGESPGGGTRGTSGSGIH